MQGQICMDSPFYALYILGHRDVITVGRRLTFLTSYLRCQNNRAEENFCRSGYQSTAQCNACTWFHSVVYTVIQRAQNLDVGRCVNFRVSLSSRVTACYAHLCQFSKQRRKDGSL